MFRNLPEAMVARILAAASQSYCVMIPRRSASSSSTRAYFVCLDCGKEFPYDWREMKVLKRFPARHDQPPDFATKRSACSQSNVHRTPA